MLEANHIYLGNCLDVMADIADGSVDAVVCDLPYGVLNRKNKAAQWDCMIPLEPLWAHYERIIKPRGAILLFAQGMFTARLMMSNPKMWRYNLVWDKVRGAGFLNAKRMPMRTHEDICVFYKQLPAYHPQMKAGEPNHSRGSLKKGVTNNCYGSLRITETGTSRMKYPGSILSFPKERGKKGSLHPTQKPVNLLRYLIRTYSEQGGLILDNAMGSGSTCVAAMMEGRRYIGIEKEARWFATAEERIREVERQPELFVYGDTIAEQKTKQGTALDSAGTVAKEQFTISSIH